MRALAWLVARRVGFSLPADSHAIAWDELNDDIVRVAVQHGVVTLATESPDFGLLPDSVQESLRGYARSEKLTALRQCASLAKITATLTAAGVPVLVLKGVAFSAVAYGYWQSRGAGADLDLLVPPNHVGAAERTLKGLGIVPRPNGNWAPTSGLLGHYALWLHYERGYTSSVFGHVDLHWRPLPGGAYWNSFESSYASRRMVALPGFETWTAGPVEALIIACSQGESETWRRLKRMADVWAAWESISVQDRQAAARLSPLVKRSITQLDQRWTAIFDGTSSAQTARERRLGLWRMRSGSGSVADAVAKSVLGAAIPARQVARLQGRSAP